MIRKPVIHLSPLLKKMKQLVSDHSPEEKEEHKEENDPPVKLRPPLTCPHRYGYLAKLPRNKPVPEECLICRKLLECRNCLG